MVPYRRGEIFIPKIADSRQITLGLWVSGRKEDGTISPSVPVEATWQKNYDKLRSLVWREDRMVVLTKRFWRGGEVVSASAEAEFVRGLEPYMETVALGRMTLTFNLPDPFFYGELKTVTLEDDTEVVEVEGDVSTNHIELDLEDDGSLLNASFEPNLTIASDVAATINVRDRMVSGQSVNAQVTYSGSNSLFLLKPGANNLTADGKVVVRYRPAYF